MMTRQQLQRCKRSSGLQKNLKRGGNNADGEIQYIRSNGRNRSYAVGSWKDLIVSIRVTLVSGNVYGLPLVRHRHIKAFLGKRFCKGEGLIFLSVHQGDFLYLEV